MSETTKIEWCDSTFNPWIGCTKIAPACDHCYAAAIDKRIGGNHWGNVARRRTSETNWHEPVRWQRRAPEFFALNGRRRRVFCASMADVFDNQVPEEWRADLWKLIEATPALDWLLLTKRPQNIRKMKPDYWDQIKGHVWLGTTVEDQKHADENIPHVLEHDAAVRFISAEPLLGPIDLRQFLHLDWVITGGESGPNARPSDPEWFTDLRYQCAEASIPFLAA
jgi:protein gp37